MLCAARARAKRRIRRCCREDLPGGIDPPEAKQRRRGGRRKRTGEFAAIWDRLVAAAEIASIAVIWFVFFAPAFYQRWVRGTSPAATAEER
jgi:hypothetical protein